MQAVREFYDEFHEQGWERFNSDKRCCVAYARIQSRRALVTHFQNSSLMHEDKRCRPVLLNLDGETPEAEPFPPPRRVGGRNGGTPGRTGGTATPATPASSVGRPSRDSTESPRSMHVPARLSSDVPCDAS